MNVTTDGQAGDVLAVIHASVVAATTRGYFTEATLLSGAHATVSALIADKARLADELHAQCITTQWYAERAEQAEAQNASLRAALEYVTVRADRVVATVSSEPTTEVSSHAIRQLRAALHPTAPSDKQGGEAGGAA